MEIVTSKIFQETREAQTQIIASILRGEIILFPTETVYGLGVDSENPAAIERLYILKGRPSEKPFQWLISNVEFAKTHSTKWNEKAERLARAFWPGPLTLVVPAGDSTIGWRIPRHDWLLGFLKALGRPLVATSANLSGQPAPKTFLNAIQDFRNEASVAVDGGDLKEGKASTVVAIQGDEIQILRQGAISHQEILTAAIK